MKKLGSLSFLLLVAISFLTVGYAAFESKLYIDGMDVNVRVDRNIRITNLILAKDTDVSQSNGKSRFDDFNVNDIIVGITLPNENDYVTYKIEVTNYGNVDMGILNISGLDNNDNLTYELKDYVLKEKICDTLGDCTNGIKKYFYLTIKYKNYDFNRIDYDVKLSFDFRQIYKITYEDINVDAPNEVIDGDNIEILLNDSIKNVAVDMSGLSANNYTYENNILKINNITGNLKIYEPSLYKIIKSKSVLDNISSEYVSSSTGINFSAISSDTNGNGVYELSSTKDKEFPIYYYRGAVNNNNVIFGGFCWQIVRTTDTGGIKLIYNGVPTKETCVATGSARTIGSNMINSPYTSLAYFGYMYGKVYNRITKNIGTSYWYNYGNKSVVKNDILTNKASLSGKTYYYSKTVSYDETTEKYTLVNPVSLSWTSNYSKLAGYYTFYSTSSSATSTTLHYIEGATSSNGYSMELTKGNLIDDVKIKLSPNISYDNGTYTLIDAQDINLSDWYTNYASYKNNYYCNDYSNNCTEINYINSTTNYQAVVVNMINGEDYNTIYQIAKDKIWYFGNSYEYDSLTNTYTLKDTKDIKPINWTTEYNTINKNHYACFNNEYDSEKTCSKVYYVYYTGNSFAAYMALENGKPLDEYIKEMTTESSNTNNSGIKKKIDTWYENNLSDYINNLEDTVYCNDRRINNLSGWNPNGGSTTGNIQMKAYSRIISSKSPSLSCNKNDSFTVSESDVGNGDLTYPIGLLSADEIAYAGAKYGSNNPNYYLYTGSTWWTISPSTTLSTVGNDVAYFFLIDFQTTNTFHIYGPPGNSNGVRPVISLKHETAPKSGIGTSESPYIIE